MSGVWLLYIGWVSSQSLALSVPVIMKIGTGRRRGGQQACYPQGSIYSSYSYSYGLGT